MCEMMYYNKLKEMGLKFGDKMNEAEVSVVKRS